MFDAYNKLINSNNYKLCKHLTKLWNTNALSDDGIEDWDLAYEEVYKYFSYYSVVFTKSFMDELKSIGVSNYNDDNGGFIYLELETKDEPFYCSGIMLIVKNGKRGVVQRLYFGDKDDLDSDDLDYIFPDEQSLRKGKLNNIDDAISIYNKLKI